MANETLNPQLEEGWKIDLAEEFGADYMKELKKKLVEEMKSGVVIYPPSKQIFNAFNLTPFDKVKVVILGQDPYHGKGQAHGLSFSVPNGVNPPPSLVNIFKEIESDLAAKPPKKSPKVQQTAIWKIGPCKAFYFSMLFSPSAPILPLLIAILAGKN